MPDAIILRLDAFRTSAPAQTERLIALGNEQWARGLKLVPLPVTLGGKLIPDAGSIGRDRDVNEDMQLEDGE